MIIDFEFASSFNSFKENNPYNLSEQFQKWKNRCKRHISPEMIQLMIGREQIVDEFKNDIYMMGSTIYTILFK